MKKLSYFLFLFSFFIVLPVFAQTATKSATPTGSTTGIPSEKETGKIKQIEDLKERLATKVAQLRQTQRKALSGTIQSTSVTTITIETGSKVVKIELTDDIKIFQMIKGKRTKLTQDALSKDDFVTVFGDYDQTLDLLQAKIIFIQSEPSLHRIGTITEINKKDFAFTFQADQQKPYMLDFESTTKGMYWNGEKQEKTGFSKFAIGDTILVTGSIVPKKENQISAERIVLVSTKNPPSPTLMNEQQIATPTSTKKL